MWYYLVSQPFSNTLQLWFVSWHCHCCHCQASPRAMPSLVLLWAGWRRFCKVSVIENMKLQGWSWRSTGRGWCQCLLKGGIGRFWKAKPSSCVRWFKIRGNSSCVCWEQLYGIFVCTACTLEKVQINALLLLTVNPEQSCTASQHREDYWWVRRNLCILQADTLAREEGSELPESADSFRMARQGLYQRKPGHLALSLPGTTCFPGPLGPHSN